MFLRYVFCFVSEVMGWRVVGCVAEGGGREEKREGGGEGVVWCCGAVLWRGVDWSFDDLGVGHMREL